MNPGVQTDQEPHLEVVSSNALESIERAQIDVQISTAKRYPRKIHEVKTAMLGFATLDQDTAEACFYTLPRGGKSIQGPSIRLAEIAVSCYGNLRCGSRVIQVVADGEAPHVVIQAVCHDLEKNVAVTIEKRRRITGKKSKGGRIDEDDINLAANAGSAIAFRDAVFKVVPLALIKPVFEAAKKVAVGDAKTLASRRTKCVETFAKMGIPKERLLQKLEKASLEEVSLDDLEVLIGLHTAIRDGDTTLDEAFPPVTKAPEHFGPAPSQPKPAPKPQDAPRPAQTTPAPATAAPAPASAQQPATEAASQGSDEAAEAAAGLAPVQAAAQPAVNTAPWTPNPNESDALNNVRFLLHQAGKSETDILPLLREKKLARDGQGLAELADAKLRNLGLTWEKVWAPLLAGQK